MRILFDGLRQIAKAALLGAFAAALATPSFASAFIGPDGAYEDFNEVNCSQVNNNKVCVMSFTPVPIGKTLVVKTLSCRIQTTKPGDIFEAYIETVGVDRRNYFVPTLSAVSSTRRVFLASSDVFDIVKMLARPRIGFTTLTGSPAGLSCSIGGTLS